MEYNGALFGQEDEAENHEKEMMQSFLEEGLNLDLPNQGEIRQGIIATIRDNEILVSIGTKSEGVISGRELEQIPDEERDAFEVGQEIPVFVLAAEDPNGNVVLSYSRAREENDWNDVQALLESNEGFDSKIIGYNKGGLIVPIGSLRGFVPSSQISLTRKPSSSDNPEQRYGKMVGDEIQVRVIEVDRERRRLILSERMALQETRETLKDRLLDELEEGTVRTGRVTSLAEFGAFVNIDGADGLVHLSEISWDRIQHPNEVLKVGDEVKVKVISVDRERKRIGLSIRQLLNDPWMQRVEVLKEGMLVEGTITHLTKFGAFAKIDEDMEGLIHVSELSEQRITHPKEVVREGDVLTLRIIKIDAERHRIGLSRRKVDSPAYADLDWKMALSDEVDLTGKEEDLPASLEDEETLEETDLTGKEEELPASLVDEEMPEEVDLTAKEENLPDLLVDEEASEEEKSGG